MFKLHICSTIENFHLCTHIPIKAINFDNTEIHSSGFDEELNRLFNSNNIIEAVQKEFSLKCNKSVLIINCSDSINFAACKICPCCKDAGFYVMGPYVSNSTDYKGIPYKPDFCIPHLITLLRSIEKEISSTEISKPLSKSIFSLHIKKALNYIENNFHSPLTLDSISDHLKINKCYLCDMLKKETGKTFSQLLNEYRIEKSKELLRKENVSILEVSMSVGFNNQNYFNKVFKKLTDKTPQEFRNSII